MTGTAYAKPLPDTTDPVMAPFWTAARQHRLCVQQCPSCSSHRWPPLPRCPECLEPGGDWVEVPARGVVWSFVVYHRAFHPSFAGDIPYAVALVELETGNRLEGRILDAPEGVSIGTPVIASFDDVTDDVTIVNWRIETGSESS